MSTSSQAQVKYVAISTRNVSTLPGRRRERIRLCKKFPGIQAAVARTLDLKGGESGVNHVINKRMVSARIEAEIIAEINRRLQAQSTAGAAGGNGQAG